MCIRDRSNTAEFFKIFENKLEYNPTRPIFFPYFSGSGTPKPNPNLKGGLFMLDLSVDIKDIFKSFLESSCFEVKKNIEWLENKFDEKINEIRAFGGGSQSNYWSQLKSHITCKHISKPKIQDAAVDVYKRQHLILILHYLLKKNLLEQQLIILCQNGRKNWVLKKK